MILLVVDTQKGCFDERLYAFETVRNKGITAEIEYITDMAKIMETGVMSMPALMIDDTVVSSGKVLKAKEIEKLL